jgi:hypothetical protein
LFGISMMMGHVVVVNTDSACSFVLSASQFVFSQSVPRQRPSCSSLAYSSWVLVLMMRFLVLMAYSDLASVALSQQSSRSGSLRQPSPQRTSCSTWRTCRRSWS